MSDALLLDAEAKLANDPDGSYKARLMALLEKYRDTFVFSRQGFLSPEQYEVAEQLEIAVQAAMTIVSNYQTVKGKTALGDSQVADSAFNTLINI